MNSRSSIKSRITRPPGFKHHLRANDNNQGKGFGISKSIKRMRIKSNTEKAVMIDSNKNKTSEEALVTVKKKQAGAE